MLAGANDLRRHRQLPGSYTRMDLEGYRTLEEYQINFYRKSNEPFKLIKKGAREAKSNDVVTCQSATLLTSTLTNINSATLLSYIYDDVDV
ncbi:hypothetical protein EVAR_99239_1 [Eumeta japonica]|uniref:Uncharacterized protein n=1 Tax=Eumeta variegata TaxID=151549 RepID=A0A4C2AH16_EUMVA|nr:hypothetical protein EVAR_99239_1 [Eumeta japonica]